MCVMLASSTVYFAITGPGQGGLVCVKVQLQKHELKLLREMFTQHRLDARMDAGIVCEMLLKHKLAQSGTAKARHLQRCTN